VFFLGLLGALFFWAIPIVVVVYLFRQRQYLKALARRLEAVERALAAKGEPALPIAAPSAGAPAPAAEARLAPEPLAPAAPAALPHGIPSPAARRQPTLVRIEEWIGGVGLQNAGSVLLLLGVLFLLLWGYGTGRLGPQVLVGAGVALGAVIAWRGDRLVPALPGFGHALVGIGLGTAYLTLCLGHFRLHVLSRELAILFLAVTSVVTILLGLRHRAQYFAILGVVGAHLPPLLGAWAPMTGFLFPAPELVGYLAAVNLAVYALAWRSGWSDLNLAAVILTTSTWLASALELGWGWPTEIGLTLLFLGLGLSPLRAIARRAAGPRPVDLAVIAAAPLGLVLCSWPFLADASRAGAAVWSGALFAVYAAAGIRLGRREPGTSLWKITTAAATLFLTIALGRTVGDRVASLAWTLEGAVLVFYGLAARSGWLRGLGYAVEGVAALSFLSGLYSTESMQGIRPPLATFTGLRDLASVIVLLVGGRLLNRTRDLLGPLERRMPEAWLGVGHFFLALWIGREAGHLASTWIRSAGPGFAPTARFALNGAAAGAGWMAQAAALVAWSGRAATPFYRWLGYGVGFFGAWALLLSLFESGTWRPGDWPVAHLSGLLSLMGILFATGTSVLLRNLRSRLPRVEWQAPEVCAAATSILWMTWTAREAGYAARALDPGAALSVANLSAALTSAAWLLQSVILMSLGWFRASAFLRWSGLVLLAITVLKFLFYDLRTVDLFWRFLTAALVGASLLAISYAYQRKRKRRDAVPGAGEA
jgi:uncharacterized membrane protein